MPDPVYIDCDYDEVLRLRAQIDMLRAELKTWRDRRVDDAAFEGRAPRFAPILGRLHQEIDSLKGEVRKYQRQAWNVKMHGSRLSEREVLVLEALCDLAPQDAEAVIAAVHDLASRAGEGPAPKALEALAEAIGDYRGRFEDDEQEDVRTIWNRRLL